MTSMFRKSRNAANTGLERKNGYLEKNPQYYNKYIKESVSKIVKILDDKQSYRYKDQQVSIGPTIEKKSVSPIFSDTSSPDVPKPIPRARAILAEEKEPGTSLSSMKSSLFIDNPVYVRTKPEKSISPPMYSPAALDKSHARSTLRYKEFDILKDKLRKESEFRKNKSKYQETYFSASFA